MDEQHGTDHSTAGLSAERIGRNDAIFREANERIEESARADEVVGAPFICECADLGCRKIVFLMLDDYFRIRQGARRFWNVPGHQASSQGWAQVVETYDTYVVVEKIGPAGEIAERLQGEPEPATASVDVDERYRRDDPV